MALIGLDFETYSAADLREVGLHNYMDHITFRPLLAAVAWDNGSMVLDLVQAHDAVDLANAIKGDTIVAHNAGFERLVLKKMGIDLPASRFVDSAVLARACGYGSGLEAAAPQILGVDKLASGKNLIGLFSIPDKDHENMPFDPMVIEKHQMEWAEFKQYCEIDAVLSLAIARELLDQVSQQEMGYADITMDMNSTGWNVDRHAVRLMRERSRRNTEAAIAKFQEDHEAHDLNLASHKQLVEWCKEHGVRATSFDEKHVRRLISKLERRLEIMDVPGAAGYERVLAMLRTKQEVGGSSLKKLDTILNQTGSDGRLRDQYLHVGAGATCRTTGRGVQMQNLKRLGGEGDDMAELEDPGIQWDNAKLARNLRQVFTAALPTGALIVGDFSSVESRGLAWQANEEWKLDAYRKGQDLYKVQAGLFYGKDHSIVTKPERTLGKVGDLACGYGAGASAVQAFAENMGVVLTEPEAADLVHKYRSANKRIVEYWYELDAMMRMALATRSAKAVLRPNMRVFLIPKQAPMSLRKQTGDMDLQSLRFDMDMNGDTVLSRWVHGTKLDGRNVRYWKSSDRKTGDLWTDRYTDPKTGLTRLYSLYGGKLTGLLTQSLCRELFFQALKDVHDWVKKEKALKLVGQFHDEIVLEWRPLLKGGISMDEAIRQLDEYMSMDRLPGFPMNAEVKADYRYTK